MEWIQEWVRILHSIHQKPHTKWEGKHPEVTAGSPDFSLRIQIMAGLGSTLGMHPRLHRTGRERHPTYPARFRTQAVTLLFPCKSTLPLCFTEYLWKGNMQSLCHKHVTLHTNIIRRKIYLDLPIISVITDPQEEMCLCTQSILPVKTSAPPIQSQQPTIAISQYSQQDHMASSLWPVQSENQVYTPKFVQLGEV